MPHNKFLFVLLILFTSSCYDNNKSIQNENILQTEVFPVGFEYKIIADESNYLKNQYQVQINYKLNEQQITNLAHKLYATKSKKDNFFIFYLLPTMQIGAGAYATSHFTPYLDFRIFGSSIQQDKNSENSINNIKGTVLGKWREGEYQNEVYVLVSDKNAYFLYTVIKGEVVRQLEVHKSKIKNADRYNYENDKGEFIVIDKNGILNYYDSEGLIFKGIKL